MSFVLWGSIVSWAAPGYFFVHNMHPLRAVRVFELLDEVVLRYRVLLTKQSSNETIILFKDSSITHMASAGTGGIFKLILTAQANTSRAVRRNITIWRLCAAPFHKPSLLRTKARLQAQMMQAAKTVTSVRPKMVSVMAA